MTLAEIQKALLALQQRGFVRSRRKGPTGVGYTLEQELGLKENNLALPDAGGRVEIKGTRRNSAAMVTLFTFNRAAWRLKQKDIIQNYGYFDGKNRRHALYSTVSCGRKNTQNLTITVDDAENKIHLLHGNDILLGSWSIYTLVAKLLTKLERLMIVLADNRMNETSGVEEFNYNEAYFLQNPAPENFLTAFKSGDIALDIRMHIKDTGTVRNHGTGFRMNENKIPNLYADKRQIL